METTPFFDEIVACFSFASYRNHVIINTVDLLHTKIVAVKAPDVGIAGIGSAGFFGAPDDVFMKGGVILFVQREENDAVQTKVPLQDLFVNDVASRGRPPAFVVLPHIVDAVLDVGIKIETQIGDFGLAFGHRHAKDGLEGLQVKIGALGVNGGRGTKN